MNILGLVWDITSSAAISMNDKIVYAASEERFSRQKSDEQYPKIAIDRGLEFCGLASSDLDRIVIGSKQIPLKYYLINLDCKFSVNDHIQIMEKYWRPKLKGENFPDLMELFKDRIDKSRYPFNTELMSYFPTEFDHHDFSSTFVERAHKFVKKVIAAHLGVDDKIVKFLDHHSCHASYGFYASPIRDDGTLVFTADSYGDSLSATISRYNGKENRLERMKEYPVENFQLGRIYRLTTLLLRMLPGEHEYKVMGLAPYYNGPKSSEVEKIFNKMQTIEGLDFKFDKNFKNIYDYLEENLKPYRFDHIAAGLQIFTENILTSWINNAISEFGGSSVVFSGGISMNIKANQKISQNPNITKFFVSGGGTDLSLAIGACYLETENSGGNSEYLSTMYLGPTEKYPYDMIEKLSDRYKISKSNRTEEILDRILAGKIVATCLGRAEFGPRALGNRSILADPRRRQNVEIINTKIKNRDFWMPFAPIVLSEYQDEVIINPKKIECPHMTIGFDTVNGKEKIPAAIHSADSTVRPMILKQNYNPKIWELVNLFYKNTGIPVLLNTSFNLHGEPMVESVIDALSVFERSDLDVLWLDNHIVEKIR